MSIPQEVSKSDIALMIRMIWKALQAPGWTFKNKKDLTALGEAIFIGKDLGDIDNKLLNRLLPHLKTVATDLIKSMHEKMPPQERTEKPEISLDKQAPETAPTEKPTAAEGA